LRALVAPIALLLLSSCAVMNADDCVQADWNRLGQRDALDGRLADRFEDRAEACLKHQVVARRDDYLIGHRLGTAGYCRAERGQQDGAAGREPAPLCSQAEPTAFDAYASGHAQGLRNAFCRPRNGYAWARSGNTNPGTCPADVQFEFEAGWRLGREVYELQRRLDQLSADIARLRRIAADDKLKPEERQRAAHSAAILDDEALRVRSSQRQAELSALSLPR
jgi:hypothetical protein